MLYEKPRRVVITGLGVVSAQGIGVNTFWNNLVQGISRVGILTCLNLDYEKYTPYGAEIKNFCFLDHCPDAEKYIPYLDVGMQYGFVGAQEAYRDSQIAKDRDCIEEDRFGVYVGTTTGGILSAFPKSKEYVEGHDGSIFDDKMLYKYCPGLWAAQLAHYFKTGGPTKSFGISCSVSGEAIGNCYQDIKHGVVDIALCGGCDAPIILLNFLSFYLLGATSRWTGSPEGACRPFSKDRSGMVFGEGSAFFILEDLELAKKRNARIYGEIVGFGATCDGYHMTAPSEDAEDYAKAIKIAMAEASLQPEDIDYISCHGTSTLLNDPAETLAIKKALGKHAYNTPIGSIKSMIGHTFGAATAMEMLTMVKVLQTQIAPPTINYAEKDESCDLDCVPNVARPIQCDCALKTSTGFGGANIALAVKRYEDD